MLGVENNVYFKVIFTFEEKKYMKKVTKIKLFLYITLNLR